MLNFKNITTAGEIADIIAGYLTISIDEKEELLELADVKSVCTSCILFVQRT